MTPPQMLQHLRAHTDFETAVQAVYYVFHSPHINRLFTEDYVAHFRHSMFAIDHLAITFLTTVPSEVQEQLMTRYPGRQQFGNNGLLAVLRKPSTGDDHELPPNATQF